MGELVWWLLILLWMKCFFLLLRERYLLLWITLHTTYRQPGVKLFCDTFMRIICIARLLRYKEILHLPIHIRHNFILKKFLQQWDSRRKIFAGCYIFSLDITNTEKHINYSHFDYCNINWLRRMQTYGIYCIRV